MMTTLTFSSWTPPRFDVEALKQWQSKADETEFTDKFMVSGFSRGSIIFTSVHNLEEVYA